MSGSGVTALGRSIATSTSLGAQCRRRPGPGREGHCDSAVVRSTQLADHRRSCNGQIR